MLKLILSGPIARNRRYGLGVLDGFEQQRTPQGSSELEKTCLVGWWIIPVAALQCNEPAIPFNRKQNSCSLRRRRRSLNE